MSSDDTECHMLVFWRWSRANQDDILREIAQRFEIRRVAHLFWEKEQLLENVRRFYAMTGEMAETACSTFGPPPYLFVLVEDRSPQYQHRISGGAGYKLVNVNSFDLKQAFRRRAMAVHASNTRAEFRRDLMLLTGERAADIENVPEKWDGRIAESRRDITGVSGWNSISEIFATMNEAVEYVVLRNFEKLPDEHVLESHGDVDLLVNDPEAVNRTHAILNGRRGVRSIVGGRPIDFDLRCINDFYYDPEWCRRILRDRVLLRGFYVPTTEDYFFSLLYHGHVHKPKIAKDYPARLLAMAGQIGLGELTAESVVDPGRAALLLSEFLKGNGYYLTKPNGCPAYNPDFVATVPNVPFLRQYPSPSAAVEASSSQPGYPDLQELSRSRKWLIKRLLARLIAYPVDLVRRNLILRS